MIQINKQGNAIVIEFTDNDKYLFDGTIEIAPNELMVVVDESEMATFKRVSNGDTLFSQRVEDIQINGITAAKDTVIDLFGSIGYTSGGGGGTGAVSSVNGQTGDVVITAAGIGAMTKDQADATYQAKGEYALKSEIPDVSDLATKNELEEKQEVFQVNAPMAFERDETTQDLHLSINLGDYAKKTDLNSKADSSTVEALSTEVATVSTNVTNLTSKVNEDSEKIASLDTEMGTKQDTLVSGTNIKTINNQSILGEGNIEITGGGTITVDAELSNTSENPVQNKVINTALGTKANTADVYTKTEVNTKVDSKVDKVEGKSLVSDTEITKLEGLKSQTEIDTSIADAKKAGTDAQTNLTTHINNKENPHEVTKEQVGLGNVDNTSDANKPISTATQEALNAKANSSDLAGKQDTLVSGTNIKTINGTSILGEGNIEIQGEGEGTRQLYYGDAMTPEQQASNKEIFDLVKAGEVPRIYVFRSPTKFINTNIWIQSDTVISFAFTVHAFGGGQLYTEFTIELNSDGSIRRLAEERQNIIATINSRQGQVNSNGELTINQTNITDATAVGQGFADSYDVKQYVDSHSGGVTVDTELSTESENPVQNKVITNALNGKQAAGDYALKSEIPDTSGLATKSEVNTLSQEVEHKADKTTVYTMEEVNTKLATKQATLVAGANITLSDPDTEGKVTISATQPDISGITTTVEELTGEVATLSTDKQDKLVSGTNIKTINGESVLGSGDIVIQAGGTVDTAMSDTSENAVQNKVIKAYIDNLVGNILTKLQEINGDNI